MAQAARKPQSVREVLERHGGFIDDLVSQYIADLQRVVSRASASLGDTLRSQVDIRNGKLDATRKTLKALRGLNGAMVGAANEAGASELNAAFANSFAGHLPYFRDILKVVSNTVDEPLRVRFSPEDKGLFARRQVLTADSLDAALEMAATRAMQVARLNVNALPYRDLIATVAETFDTTALQARTIAATSQSVFFREIAGRGYERIAEAYPSKVTLRYRYEGPEDKLTRPFCDKMLARMAKSGPVTREEIDKLDNEEEQLSDAWLHCGGYNCRHQWVLEELDK